MKFFKTGVATFNRLKRKLIAGSTRASSLAATPTSTPVSTLVSALALLFLFLFPLPPLSFLSLPEVKAQSEFRVMFYNVENLFDTRDDPLKDDDDFLLDGFMRWTPKRYKEKLRDITRVITAVGEMQSPALIGLCEVENDSVLFDLTRRSPCALRSTSTITQSPDEGASTWRSSTSGTSSSYLNGLRTRYGSIDPTADQHADILHVVGQLVNTDTLDLFICHFPSRSDGQLATRPASIAAAETLRKSGQRLVGSSSSLLHHHGRLQ